MSITIDAVYEGGVLKTNAPLTLQDGTHVRIVVTPVADIAPDPLSNVIGICKSGDGVALAECHDEILYGGLGKSQK